MLYTVLLGFGIITVAWSLLKDYRREKTLASAIAYIVGSLAIVMSIFFMMAS